jgi:hypothetical protein
LPNPLEKLADWSDQLEGTPLKPWDRQPGEPLEWFMRFEKLRTLGPGATPLMVANLERSLSGREQSKDLTVTWRKMISKWQWRQRHEAYFMDQVRIGRLAELEAGEERRKQEEADRLEERKTRRDMVKMMRSKWAKALTNLNPADVSPRFVLDGFVAILQQGRAEWDDEPIQRRLTQSSGDKPDVNIDQRTQNLISISVPGQPGIGSTEEQDDDFWQEVERAALEAGLLTAPASLPAPESEAEPAIRPDPPDA